MLVGKDDVYHAADFCIKKAIEECTGENQKNIAYLVFHKFCTRYIMEKKVHVYLLDNSIEGEYIISVGYLINLAETKLIIMHARASPESYVIYKYDTHTLDTPEDMYKNIVMYIKKIYMEVLLTGSNK